METTEGNKLIAEFMGLAYCEKYQYTGWYKTSEFNYRICDYDGLKYHNSWDWLIPVVEKIEKTNNADIIIHAKNLVIISFNGETQELFTGDLINNVWRACLEFIEYYNSLNQC